MDSNTTQQLFVETTYYTSKMTKKESTSELRDCYEKHTHTYISAPDFIKGLKDLGYRANKNDIFKLRMKKTVRKQYFGYLENNI